MKKKRIFSLISLLLCALLLCGCAEWDEAWSEIGNFFADSGEQNHQHDNEDMVPFSQMAYERPDVEELEKRVALVQDALDQGKRLHAVEDLLDDCYESYYQFSTMLTLADIHNCLDLSDNYYADEYDWCSEQYARVRQLMDDMFYACGGSSLAKDLEEDYFWEGFAEEYSNKEDSIYTDAMVALMQEESDLVMEYREMDAIQTVVFRGEEQLLDDLLETLRGEDYLEALNAYYEQSNQKYADLLRRMVAVREKQAAELGYDSYEAMQYEISYERDYTPEVAAAYLEDIKTWLAPLYQELLNSKVMNQVGYQQSLDENKLEELLSLLAERLGEQAQEAYRFMKDYELSDIKKSENKVNMSFVIYIDNYNAPFLFVNASGYLNDLLTCAHEFGHFCDAYVNWNASETIDLAEVYSTSLENLSLTCLQGALSERELNDLTKKQMIDNLELYVYQGAYASFEHRLYETGSDNLDAETINRLFREATEEFGVFDSNYEMYYSRYWADIPHFFEQPLYIISYPVSIDVAMQLYAMELEEEGSGLARYVGMLERDFGTLPELVEAHGFEGPFDEGRIEKIAAELRLALGL